VTNKSRHDHGTVHAGMHYGSGNWSGWRHKAQVRGAIKWRSQHVHPKPRGDIKNVYTKNKTKSSGEISGLPIDVRDSEAACVTSEGATNTVYRRDSLLLSKFVDRCL